MDGKFSNLTMVTYFGHSNYFLHHLEYQILFEMDVPTMH